METDPVAYGLRSVIIRDSITDLLDSKSILITGGRGIGKSSLCYHLQKILSGDKTLLQRCEIGIKIDTFITVSYTCSPDDTLETIINTLMRDLDTNLDCLNSKCALKDTTLQFSFLNAFTLTTTLDKSEHKMFTTLVDSFVKVMKQFKKLYREPHINISIDELDQIPESENIAHFTKVVLEQMIKSGNDFLTFIFVGQEVLFERMLKQQPAFHRIFKHFNLGPLQLEDTEEVVDSCLKRSNVPATMDDEAKEFIVNLSCGYPAVIQLLGHESFTYSLIKYDKIPKCININMKDVLHGVQKIIHNESERFQTMFDELSEVQKTVILSIADSRQAQVPFTFTMQNISDGIIEEDAVKRSEVASSVFSSLKEKQILISKDEKINANAMNKQFSFREELFRVYLNDKLHNNEKMLYD